MLGIRPRFGEIFTEPGKYEDVPEKKLVVLLGISVSKKGIQFTGWPFAPGSKHS